MGGGFINWGYIVVEKNTILDMKGLSYSMSRLFDYLSYVPCLSRAQVFSSSACTPMDNYGCTWNSFESKDRRLDTEQYALHAGGHRFESCTAHHFRHELVTSPKRPGKHQIK